MTEVCGCTDNYATHCNKDIVEFLRTMRDVFCSEAEMNGYLEIDQEIQNTEDFSV